MVSRDRSTRNRFVTLLESSQIPTASRGLSMICSTFPGLSPDASRFGRRGFPLTALAEEVAEHLKPLATEKLIRIEVPSPDPSATVWADRDKVTQVLMNLIGNAVKFTPQEGKVTVALEKNDNDYVQISVADTGPGILPEETNKIFSKFYQVDQYSQAKTQRQRIGSGHFEGACGNAWR